MSIRVGLVRTAVWFTYFAYEEIMIIDGSLQETLSRWYIQTGGKSC